MGRKKSILMASACIVLSMVLAGPAAHAAETFLRAFPSTHHVTVDGVPVSVEAYTINGSNYVKLRDIAALVGFGVTWDSDTRTVEIDTGADYADAEQPETTATAPNSGMDTDLDSVQEEIIALTNELRRDNGLSVLIMDKDLMAAAQVRAEEAAANLAYRHTRPDGSDNDTVLPHTGTLLLGENMGMKDLTGSAVSELAEIQVTSWSHSLGHYKNMLNTIYHATGVGIARDEYGMYYVIQLFAGGDYAVTGIDSPILP